jgi:hypothetical protein
VHLALLTGCDAQHSRDQHCRQRLTKAYIQPVVHIEISNWLVKAVPCPAKRPATKTRVSARLVPAGHASHPRSPTLFKPHISDPSGEGGLRNRVRSGLHGRMIQNNFIGVANHWRHLLPKNRARAAMVECRLGPRCSETLRRRGFEVMSLVKPHSPKITCI